MEKLTIEIIKSKIVAEEYRKMGSKTTVCLLTLKNGFEVIGTSACVDPSNFDMEIGKKIAYDNAIEKVWELEGYLLQESNSFKGVIFNMDQEAFKMDIDEWVKLENIRRKAIYPSVMKGPEESSPVKSKFQQRVEEAISKRNNSDFSIEKNENDFNVRKPMDLNDKNA
jgi:hypothetical protein